MYEVCLDNRTLSWNIERSTAMVGLMYSIASLYIGDGKFLTEFFKFNEKNNF